MELELLYKIVNKMYFTFIALVAFRTVGIVSWSRQNESGEERQNEKRQTQELHFLQRYQKINSLQTFQSVSQI